MEITDKEFVVPPVPAKSKPNPLLVPLLTAKPIANPHLGKIETSKKSEQEGSEVNKSLITLKPLFDPEDSLDNSEESQARKIGVTFATKIDN